MKAWALSTSPAVVRIAPSIAIVTRLCADWSFRVNLIEPFRLLADSLALWGRVYHTLGARAPGTSGNIVGTLKELDQFASDVSTRHSLITFGM